MKKMLMLASVGSMIDQFNKPQIKLLQSMGYQVDVAANFQRGSTSSTQRGQDFLKELTALNINYHQIDFSRNIFDIRSIYQAFKQLKHLISSQEYDFIHCHSPIGGAVSRIIARKENIPVVYTAHGFHFLKGGRKINWLLFYPLERFLARYTDILITINKEDYQRARKFKAKKVLYTPGVGVDVDKFNGLQVDKLAYKRKLGLSESDILLLSVGELNTNKNHARIIESIASLNNPKLQYLICGKGDLLEELAQLARDKGIGEQVHFLGFREDMAEIYKTADIFIFPSYREGLSLALMEAMASSLPVICSKIRGNVDLIHHDKGGFLIKPTSTEGFTRAIQRLVDHPQKRIEMGAYNKQIVQNFSLEPVLKQMKEIYESIEENIKTPTSYHLGE